jgi:hypothetical protein
MKVHPAIDPSVLGCIVTGFAKGGTTLLKDLLVQTTDMIGRFEGGLLLVESPAEGIPEPHAGNIDYAWKPAAGFFDGYRTCRTFEEGYRLLRESSMALLRHDGPLIDKTPQYLVCLADVMRRAPGTPVVVIVRDPLHVAVSWLALGNSVAGTASWLTAATESLVAAIDDDGGRRSPMYILAFADLLADANAALAPLQAWLGRPNRPMPEGQRYGLPFVQAGRDRLPREIEHDRHDLSRRCTPEELTRVQRDLLAGVPLAARVSGLRSGPVGPSIASLRAA